MRQSRTAGVGERVARYRRANPKMIELGLLRTQAQSLLVELLSGLFAFLSHRWDRNSRVGELTGYRVWTMQTAH